MRQGLRRWLAKDCEEVGILTIELLRTMFNQVPFPDSRCLCRKPIISGAVGWTGVSSDILHPLRTSDVWGLCSLENGEMSRECNPPYCVPYHKKTIAARV